MTLLDLRNAFREVHHNLTDCVLEHHHVPEDIRENVKKLYCCFKSYMLTDGISNWLRTYGKRFFYKGIVSVH